ncbi:hypothetical protein [uncultured Croceitalea sp.]|uniref:hypothetical protein n=1 Tax=uncultured Croceitalea sp. TaxID=1798908 RepID=UPI00330655A0
MKFVLIALVILTSSCKNQKGLVVTDESQDNSLTLLVQDGYFFTDSIETSVVRDEKTLKSFFSRVNRTRKPGLPVPKINFEEEMVLVVCMGEQKTTAMPYLDLVARDNQKIKVGIAVQNETETKNTVVSYPFCVYKIPTSEKEIIFKLVN